MWHTVALCHYCGVYKKAAMIAKRSNKDMPRTVRTEIYINFF